MDIKVFEKVLTREDILNLPFEESNVKCKNIYQSKVILGIDIYRYSKYALVAQTLIPYIFHKIIYSVIDDLNKYEPLFFANYSQNTFNNNFINTGDGGYIILDTPIHGLLFSIYLSSRLKTYNTGNLYPKEYEITGEITYRYAMCLGELFNFEDNWFGPAIITCARILSIDKLNRFLLEENVKEWFEQNINGIETLLSLGLNNLREKSVLKKYFKDYNKDTRKSSLIIPPEGNDPGLINSNIINIKLSKIDTIEIKNDKISIYNLHLQVYIVRVTFQNAKDPEKYVISIGNLNVTGLSK